MGKTCTKPSKRQTQQYDRGAYDQRIEVGDEVLVLLLDSRKSWRLEPLEETKELHRQCILSARDAKNAHQEILLKRWHQPKETEAAVVLLALTEIRAGEQTANDICKMLGHIGRSYLENLKRRHQVAFYTV